MATLVSRKAPSASTPPAERRIGRTGGVLLICFGLLGLVLFAGLPYYLMPQGERLRSMLHPWFKPSGYVGQSAGLLTFAGFLFMWLYPLRKKLRRPAWLGAVPKWLDVHIAVGLLLPLLGAIHASWRFNGVIGLGYLAMLIVCLSGVVGRYIYMRIPRSRQGLELGMGETAAQQRALLGQLAESTGLSVLELQEILSVNPMSGSRGGVLATLAQMVRDDLARARAVRRLRARWQAAGQDRAPVDHRGLREVSNLARRQMSLSQQVRLLDATHRIFRYWHAAHRPFAITAVIAVTIHVVVVVAVGATWLR